MIVARSVYFIEIVNEGKRLLSYDVVAVILAITLSKLLLLYTTPPRRVSRFTAN